jgi:hypothetical protein
MVSCLASARSFGDVQGHASAISFSPSTGYSTSSSGSVGLLCDVESCRPSAHGP